MLMSIRFDGCFKAPADYSRRLGINPGYASRKIQ
jgi:hypothetical protein